MILHPRLNHYYPCVNSLSHEKSVIFDRSLLIAMSSQLGSGEIFEFMLRYKLFSLFRFSLWRQLTSGVASGPVIA